MSTPALLEQQALITPNPPQNNNPFAKFFEDEKEQYWQLLERLGDAIDLKGSMFDALIQYQSRNLSTYELLSLDELLSTLKYFGDFTNRNSFKENFRDPAKEEIAWDAWMRLWVIWQCRVKVLIIEEEIKLKKHQKKYDSLIDLLDKNMYNRE